MKASGLVATLQEQSTDISNKLINMFPPKEIVLKTKTIYNKDSGKSYASYHKVTTLDY